MPTLTTDGAIAALIHTEQKNVHVAQGREAGLRRWQPGSPNHHRAIEQLASAQLRLTAVYLVRDCAALAVALDAPVDETVAQALHLAAELAGEVEA